MNSASKAFAISRARVVLPTPGGPHRIIECGLPDSKREAQRLARAEQVLLADHFVERLRAQRLGERRGGLAPCAKRSRGRSFSIRLGRRRPSAASKRNSSRVDLRVALEVGEAQARGLAEVSVSSIACRPSCAEAHAHALEAGVALLRLGFEPFQAVLRCPASLQRRSAFSMSLAAGEQRRGRRAERRGELAHRDLVQVPVVDPHALAVADDHLVGRLVVDPAEACPGRWNTKLPCASPASACRCGRTPSARSRARADLRGAFRNVLKRSSAGGVAPQKQRGARAERPEESVAHERDRTTPPWRGPAPRGCRWTASPTPCPARSMSSIRRAARL